MRLDEITAAMIDNASPEEMQRIRRAIHDWVASQIKPEQITDYDAKILARMHVRAKNGYQVQETIKALEAAYKRTRDLKWLDMADELDGGVSWE